MICRLSPLYCDIGGRPVGIELDSSAANLFFFETTSPIWVSQAPRGDRHRASDDPFVGTGGGSRRDRPTSPPSLSSSRADASMPRLSKSGSPSPRRHQAP